MQSSLTVWYNKKNSTKVGATKTRIHYAKNRIEISQRRKVARKAKKEKEKQIQENKRLLEKEQENRTRQDEERQENDVAWSLLFISGEQKLRDEAVVNDLLFIKRDHEEKITIARIILSIRNLLLKSHFDEIEAKLHKYQYNKSYRKKIKTAWSFHLGYTTQTPLGFTEFFAHPHPIQQKPWSQFGCDVRSPLDKSSIPQEQKEFWLLATELMKIIDPEYISKQYVVHFAKMNEMKHDCPLHTDERDIGPQYIIHFGNFEGAELRVYGTTRVERTTDYFSVSKPRQIIFLDARFAHEVRVNNFRGVRFSMIVYQLWREDKLVPDPLLYPPRILN
jgi:hypothetical protein